MTSTSALWPGLTELHRSLDDASAGAQRSEARRVRIAGHVVELRFASPGLVPCVMPALAHLAVDSTSVPELVIDIWDTSTSGAAPPPTPEADPESPLGAFYFFGEAPLRGVYQPGMHALSVVDLDRDHAWYHVEDPEALPYWERAAPLRQVLHWWMSTRGHQQVHSGAVGLPDGGVLLVGKGGSGKSTCSLVSLGSDLRYAGDDYAMVSVDPEPMVHSLYGSGKVHADNLARLPHLLPALSNADLLDTEKGVVYVHEHFPDRMIGGFPLKAIVLPRITGRAETRTVPVSGAAALAALAPSTVFQLHNSGAEALSTMARLVRTVPAYALELGADVTDVPPVLTALLADLRQRP